MNSKELWHVSFVYADGTVGWREISGTLDNVQRELQDWEPTTGYAWPVAFSAVQARAPKYTATDHAVAMRNYAD